MFTSGPVFTFQGIMLTTGLEIHCIVPQFAMSTGITVLFEMSNLIPDQIIEHVLGEELMPFFVVGVTCILRNVEQYD